MHKILVVGSGTMGCGIAYASVRGGFETVLNDVSGELLNKALAGINQTADEAIERGKLDPAGKKAALGRLRLEPDLAEAVTGVDLVIEAVPEDIGLKCQLFGRLDQLVADHAILASNTSSLSVTEIAAATGRPERVIGMHFFNPVPKMKLIEIVRGLDTGERAIRMVQEVAQGMGKETVLIRESPGFLTSRINALIGNEAFYMLQEGVASAPDIDKALKLGLNHPLGPFEMVDLVGLDVRLGVLHYLQDRLGEKYRPCPLLIQYVKAGRLGRKVGRGVYDYPEKT